MNNKHTNSNLDLTTLQLLSANADGTLSGGFLSIENRHKQNMDSPPDVANMANASGCGRSNTFNCGNTSNVACCNDDCPSSHNDGSCENTCCKNTVLLPTEIKQSYNY